MIIIGAGYVGVEFAQMYARFGTKVVMLGRAPRVMPHEDEEVSAVLADVLWAEGIDLYISAPVLRAEREGRGRSSWHKSAGRSGASRPR